MGAEAGLPLTAAQSGVWIAQQLNPDSRAFTTGQFVDLTGPVDISLLRAAITRALSECDALRMRIADDSGEFCQVPGEAPVADVPVIDLSHEPCPRSAANTWMRADLSAPAYAAGADLFSTAVLTLGPDSCYWYQRCHHVLVDAYGGALFLRRVAEIYTAFIDAAEAAPSPFGRLTRILEEERAYRDSSSYERDRDYWRQRFADQPEVRGLSDTLVATADRVITTEFSVPSAVVEGICRKTGHQPGAWPAALTAVLAGYTHRITGAEDVILGMPVAARRSPLQLRTPCMLASVLPLRLRVSPDTMITDLIRQSSHEMNSLLRHQRYSQTDLRRDLGYVDDRRLYGPEINILSFGSRIRFGHAEGSLNFLSTGPIGDISLSFHAPSDGTIGVLLEAAPRTYTEDDIARHAARFTEFIGTLATNAHRPVADAEILTQAERRTLLIDWNATTVPETYEDVVSRIRKVAADRPTALAVADHAQRLDYATLVGRASALSRRLLRSGIAPGDLCAVLTGRGVHVVTAMLGIWGAGGAYVHLDVAAPIERTVSLLRDSGITRILTDETHLSVAERAARLAGPGLDIMALDDAADRLEKLSTLVDGGDTVAYVYFTSGSTGRPKGAMVHRHGMINHLMAKVESLGMAASDSVVHNAPLTFDVSVWQMISALLVGGWTRIADEAASSDPFALFEIITAEENTILEVVPSFMRAALDSWPAAQEAPRLPTLRWFVVNGEVLPPELCQRWFSRYPHTAIINAYGTTECSDDVTHAVLTKDSDYGVVRVPVGGPLRNLRLYVLDGKLRPAPIGTPGELYVGGVGVGRGYVNDPKRTCTVFVPDPFAHGTGARMYRTGDIVRYLPDGQLDFLGRRDFQVKIRGQRIEMGEVEAVLRAAPGVSDAVAVVRTGPVGQKLIVAYVTGTRDIVPVKAHATSLLPNYSAPSLIVAMPELPLNQNGKVDREALPDPEFVSETGFQAPMERYEELLTQIFAEVLGLPGVGADDDFFNLGGDSILSIQVVSKARQADLVFSPRDVFMHRTPSALARAAHGPSDPLPTAPVAENGTGLVPATPAMHWLRELGGPVDGFHQSLVVRLPDSLDRDEFLAAVQALLDRHDMLRARLVRSPGDLVWALRVASPGDVRAESCLRVVDAAEVARQEWEDLLLGELDAAVSWLAPDKGLMLRLVWFDGGGSAPSRLLLVAHHLVIDAVSWHVLLPDLETAWRAIREGGGPRLPETGMSFQRWAREQTLAAQDPELAATVSQWERLLSGNTISFDRRPPGSRPDTMAGTRSHTAELDTTATEHILTTVPDAFGATAEEVVITGLALALSEWGTGDLLIDREGHGRHDSAAGTDLSRTIGWFTSISPVRIGLSDLAGRMDSPETVVAALKRVKELVRNLPGDAMDFGLLRYLNPVTRSVLGSHARPEVAFTYLGRVAMSARSDGRDWAPLPESEVLTRQRADLPVGHVLDIVALTRMLPDDGPQLSVTVTWVTDAVPERAVLRSVDRWLDSLRLLSDYVIRTGVRGLTPSDVPLLTLSQEEIEEFERGFD